MSKSLEQMLKDIRRAPWGCLADECPETRRKCADITEHMMSAHPELKITPCGCGL